MKVWQPLAMEYRLDANGEKQFTAVSLVDKSSDPHAGFWREVPNTSKRGFGKTCPTCAGCGRVDGDKKTCSCEEDCFCMRGSTCPQCKGRCVVD